MPALYIHSPKLDTLYRAYLLGRICDREFSQRVDRLILQGRAAPDNLSPNGGHFASRADVVNTLSPIGDTLSNAAHP